MSIRSIPRHAFDRILGEGDRCMRDKQGRIIAWAAGTPKEDRDKLLKEIPGSYESVGMYDTEKEAIV